MGWPISVWVGPSLDSPKSIAWEWGCPHFCAARALGGVSGGRQKSTSVAPFGDGFQPCFGREFFPSGGCLHGLHGAAGGF